MKIAVSAWSLQKLLFKDKMNIFEFLDFAFEQGVDGVELLDCFWKTPKQIQEVKKKVDGNNWDIACYSIGNDFVTLDDSELEGQIIAVKQGIDVAADLGTKLLRVFSGNSKQGISYDQGMEKILKGFKECAPYAEEKGITMVLENHGLFAGKSDQVLAILEEVGSPNLKANADTGNFLLVLEDPLEAIKNLGKQVGFVHFKDFKKLAEENGKETYSALDSTLYQGTPIGKGDVPLKEIVSYLDDIGYDGYLSIEYEGVGDPIEETKESIEFLKGLAL